MSNDQEAQQLTCPFCHRVSDYGVRVCLGCNATIVYEAVDSDIAGVTAFYFVLLVVLGIPACNYVSFHGMRHSSDAHIGLGFAVMFILPLLPVLLLVQWKARRLKDKPRFFR